MSADTRLRQRKKRVGRDNGYIGCCSALVAEWQWLWLGLQQTHDLFRSPIASIGPCVTVRVLGWTGIGVYRTACWRSMLLLLFWNDWHDYAISV
jgi:hypothetical protein